MKCNKCGKLTFEVKSGYHVKRMNDIYTRNRKCTSCGYTDTTIEISRHEYACQRKLLLQLQSAVKEYTETTKKTQTKQVIGANRTQ